MGLHNASVKTMKKQGKVLDLDKRLPIGPGPLSGSRCSAKI